MTFYAAKFTGQLTQALLTAGLFVVASQASNATAGLTSVMLAGIAAALCFGFLAGAAVDRVGPARAYAAAAALRMAPPVLALLFAHSMPVAIALAFSGSALIQVFGPAEMSLVRQLKPRAPAQAHALLVFLQYGGQAVGAAALAPALYFSGGTNAIFAGASVAAVAFFVLALRLAREAGACEVRSHAARPFAFRPTLGFLASDERARYAVGALALKTAVSRGVVVALPLYVHSDADAGNMAIGGLVAVGACGAIVGLIWSARGIGAATANRTMRLGMLGIACGALALAVFDYGILAVATVSHVGPFIRLESSINTTFWLAIPAAFLLGLSFAGALIGARVALTASAPLADQGRIFATQAVITEALLALPLLLTGVGVQYAGARTTLAALGVASLVVVLLLELSRNADRTRAKILAAASA